MIIKLSEFMRYSLNFPDESMSTLERELYHIQLYLDIEKVRFGEKLQFTKEIEKNCLAISLPSMILQPIIENAVKYGVYENTSQSHLLLKTSCNEEYLMIYIENDFDPEASFKKGTGTGLRNVGKRLQTAYGTKDLLRTRKENNLFIVEITIPKHG
jgi:LytS/YehU family sensor histidine kinase